MKLATFVPSYRIEKEGSTNNKDPSFNEKYKHFQSITPNYRKVEEFLDAPIHKKNSEIEKLRQDRDEAISKIVAIEEMEYNEMSEKIQEQLEENWRKRSECNTEMDRVMKDLTDNHLFYKRIKRVVKRRRHISKRINEQGSIAKIFTRFFTHVDESLINLYQLDLNNRQEIARQLTNLDIHTHGMKRLSLVTSQVSRDYIGWETGVPNSVLSKREDRLEGVCLKIETIQMQSFLTEADLNNLTTYMEILREIPSWDPRIGLERKIFVNGTYHLVHVDINTITELQNQYNNPVRQFIMRDELILFDDDRIISGITPVEDRDALAHFNTSNDPVQFLSQHTTNGIANCSIHVSVTGHYFLYAIRDIEKGDLLKSSMTKEAFLKWIGWSDPDQPVEMNERNRIRSKIASLEKEMYPLDKNDLKRIDLTLRIKFLKKLTQKKVILSDGFSV